MGDRLGSDSGATPGLAVVAIGGNSLTTRGRNSYQDQYGKLQETCNQIAALARAGWGLVITHGNGPQVGFILRRSELASHEVHSLPLDACGANSQGCIGYALQQNLGNAFRRAGVKRKVATLITQVEVDPKDEAFTLPSKPIGSFLDEPAAEKWREKGWSLMEDAGRGWRRVVPSPKPQSIVELPLLSSLVSAGVVVVALGGGGIPVTRDDLGQLRGIPAVIDKDLASALLAEHLGADLLAICTGVEKVALHFGKPEEVALDHLTLTEARRYLQEGVHFAAGSMGPKVEAIVRYLDQGGQRAIVTRPERLMEAFTGETGTHFSP
ncbi:MAG: carbamate kinase [Deltaproteobacteria bacterium]|nr:carbamate kinase [Deltaproteobacteria bacterium]